jgi:hypothetical protein
MQGGQGHQPSVARQAIAAVLDVFTFFIAGALITVTIAGSQTPHGDFLNGWTTWLVFVSTGVYVVFGKKLLGGTLWQRLLRV